MALFSLDQVERGQKLLERFFIFFSRRYILVVILLSLTHNVWKEIAILHLQQEHRQDLRAKDSIIASKDALNRELNREVMTIAEARNREKDNTIASLTEILNGIYRKGADTLSRQRR